MAMRTVLNEIRGLKLKDVPQAVKPMLSMNFLKKSFTNWVDNYQKKYILTSSIQPLYHTCFGGMAFSYILAYPEERRHMEHKKHEEEQKKHAKEHGGH